VGLSTQWRQRRSELGELFLLTGPPRSGKTTVTNEVINRLRARGVRVGGMTTSEVTQGGVRRGFQVMDISSGRTGTLAQVSGLLGPRIGKYTVNQADLDDVGVKAIESAEDDADLIVIDEVGPMELTSRAFVNAVETALRSTKPVILTLHWKVSHPLLDRIRIEARGKLTTVTPENRAMLAPEIEHMILETILPRKE
jgi:nucleoside-triphosphatase